MTGELEYRASRIAEVSFPKRLIELVVMPYETEAVVEYHGRLIQEICSKGAYDGVERRTSQIKVNLDHDRRQVVGRTVALHPSRVEGLVAEIRVTRAPEGEPILIKADEGLLDASAGFGLMLENGRVKAGAEVWETRDRRRLNHLYLDHIALTPDPAYTDARVLAVRTQPGGDAGTVEALEAVQATPNLDRLEIERLRAVAADIDARYGLSR
jgi:phage head maturation protease